MGRVDHEGTGIVSKHAILLITYNNLEMTKIAVASCLNQEVGCDLWVIDNGSTDGTRDWLDLTQTHRRSLMSFRSSDGDKWINIRSYPKNVSPVAVANGILHEMFGCGYDTVLTVPNDVYLPYNLYGDFLDCPRGVVTGSMTEDRSDPYFTNPMMTVPHAVSECTPLAVVMWRPWVYKALCGAYGHFLDPGFFHYASDCDLALRMAALGIRGVQLSTKYWHFGSASHRTTEPAFAEKQRKLADKDREYFEKKWGFKVFDPEYTRLALDINFRGKYQSDHPTRASESTR